MNVAPKGYSKEVTIIPSRSCIAEGAGSAAPSLSDLICINAAHAYTPAVNMKHDAGGFLTRFLKESFQNMHDKFHWRVVVIQHQNLVHGGLSRLWARPYNHTGVRSV
jgi:hypothetical protein